MNRKFLDRLLVIPVVRQFRDAAGREIWGKRNVGRCCRREPVVMHFFAVNHVVNAPHKLRGLEVSGRN